MIMTDFAKKVASFSCDDLVGQYFWLLEKQDREQYEQEHYGFEGCSSKLFEDSFRVLHEEFEKRGIDVKELLK